MAQLRHPLSVDLYADAVIARARFVLVRCLGGLDYWRYGLERLAETCRAHGIPFAVLRDATVPTPASPRSPRSRRTCATPSTGIFERAAPRTCAGSSPGSPPSSAARSSPSRPGP